METTLDSRAEVPRRTARSFVGEARFDGYFIATALPREQAAACLPPGFVPAERPYGRPSTSYPAVLVFGRQSDTAVWFAGTRWPTGFRYLEAALLLPFVRREGRAQQYLYLPRIYAGDRWAKWSGNLFYGYNKVLAALHWISDTLVVGDPSGALALEAKVESASEWEPAAAGAAFARTKLTDAFAPIHALADLPIAGRRSDDSLVTSWFDWDVRAASLRGVRAALSLGASVAPGLGPLTCAGIEGESFELSNLRWRVSWPAPFARSLRAR